MATKHKAEALDTVSAADPQWLWMRHGVPQGGRLPSLLRVIAQRPQGQPTAAAPALPAGSAPGYGNAIPGTAMRSNYFTAWVAPADLPAFATQVQRFAICVPHRPASVNFPPVDAATAILGEAAHASAPLADAPAVVVGVIDDGCAFLHSAFRQRRDENKSRILALWDQDQAGDAKPWRAVPAFGYGRQLLNADIDAMLPQGSTPDAAERCYTRVGHPSNTLCPSRTHGTSVLSLAAASDDPSGLAGPPSDAGIVFVHLPRMVSTDTSGGALPSRLLDGIRYILDVAAQYERKGQTPVPVVINVSYGFTAGPHDGHSLIEEAMDELIEQHPCLTIVLAAGNSHAEELTARGTLSAQQALQELQWFLRPGDDTDTFMEIWLRGAEPLTAAADLKHVHVSVHGPDGQAAGPALSLGQYAWLQGVQGAAQAGLVAFRLAPDGQQAQIYIAMAPTTGHRVRVSPGYWTVRLGSAATQGGTVSFSAYVQRDDRADFGPSGEQSRLLHAGERADTYSALATGRHTVVVGGHSLRASGKRKPLMSSGEGLSRGDRKAPDLSVQCEWNDPDSLPTLPFLGTRQVPFGRTSAAAAVATRHLAALAGKLPTSTARKSYDVSYSKRLLSQLRPGASGRSPAITVTEPAQPDP